jgi:pimeloyl-ACP methyl ester carboxylesterase
VRLRPGRHRFERPSAGGVDLTSGDQADELLALLDGAGIEPPYVLAAHSYGGFVSRLFGSRYPGETAGLVLIEGSHDDEIAAYRRFYGGSSESDWVDGGDLLDIQATAAELQDSARNYGDSPLVAIRAERYEDVLAESLWVRTRADLATLSSGGLQVVALDSGHVVMDDSAPVVVAAVEAVVEASRSGERLPPCEDLFANLEADCPT